MNQDLRTYIDSVKKERASSPEQNTLHLDNIANITIDSEIITQQKKKNGREEDCQEYCHIPIDKNGEHNSIIASETIEPNANETIEPNTIKQI